MSVALPRVRAASATDLEEILQLCRQLWEENGLFSYDEDRIRALAERGFRGEGVVIGVIGPEKGPLEGSVCITVEIAGNYYSGDVHLVELWNYVAPDYRKSRNAQALIDYMVTVARGTNMALITGIITNSRTAGKVRLYRQLLGEPAGAFFVVNSKWREAPTIKESDEERELIRQLREFADKCTAPMPKNIPYRELRDDLKAIMRDGAPLFREAAEKLDFWGTLPVKQKAGGG